MQPLHNQRGWIGLVVLLFALVIVGLTARTVLKQYGPFASSATHSEETSRAGVLVPRYDERAGGDDASAVQNQSPMDRARQLGNTVRRQAGELGQRIDEADK